MPKSTIERLLVGAMAWQLEPTVAARLGDGLRFPRGTGRPTRLCSRLRTNRETGLRSPLRTQSSNVQTSRACCAAASNCGAVGALSFAATPYRRARKYQPG